MVSEVAKAINDNGIAIWDSFDIEVTVWVDSYILEFVVLINSKIFVLGKFSNYEKFILDSVKNESLA